MLVLGVGTSSLQAHVFDRCCDMCLHVVTWPNVGCRHELVEEILLALKLSVIRQGRSAEAGSM